MFKLLKTSKISRARLGEIRTKRGVIKTPFFMPDATRAVIKELSAGDLIKAGLECPVVNTFHLYLQPGLKIIKKAKSIHNFMHWQKPILSDSGGYQVFSLIHKSKNAGKVLDDKVIFKSPLDGRLLDLSPEKSIKIQFDLGVDMMVCFDDCPPNDYSKEKIKQSVLRTISWAKRCKQEYLKQLNRKKISRENRPLLFSVIQGGTSLKLRKICASELISIDFDGFGFGARHISPSGKFLKNVLKYTAELIPENKLRFALGAGTPEDIINCVKLGWDMFDCVIPTREGRHGRLFLKNKKIGAAACFNKNPNKYYKTSNINNAGFKADFSPINAQSEITELRQYSKAYLYHLFKINEPLGARLASQNNLEFYLKLLAEIRQAIANGKL